MKRKTLPEIQDKKVPGVILDNELNFKRHIDKRVNKAFKALKALDVL